jgi:hypothetical protein
VPLDGLRLQSRRPFASFDSSIVRHLGIPSVATLLGLILDVTVDMCGNNLGATTSACLQILLSGRFDYAPFDPVPELARVRFRSDSLLDFFCDTDTVQVVFPSPGSPYLALAVDTASKILNPSFVACLIRGVLPVGREVLEDNDLDKDGKSEVP